jgi:hypothetical protein
MVKGVLGKPHGGAWRPRPVPSSIPGGDPAVNAWLTEWGAERYEHDQQIRTLREQNAALATERRALVVGVLRLDEAFDVDNPRLVNEAWTALRRLVGTKPRAAIKPLDIPPDAGRPMRLTPIAVTPETQQDGWGTPTVVLKP